MTNQNQSQNQNNSGDFPLGFSLGAVAGVALSYFLQTEQGKYLTEELKDEIAEFKSELSARNLIPDEKMSAPEIISHVIAHMAEHESKEDAELKKKQRSTKRKKISPTLAKSSSKKKQKKFSGV